MAACRSPHHIFENPLPENPTLLESLSLSQIKPIRPIEQSSFTGIFGELPFKENPDLFFPPSSLLDSVPQKDILRTPETKSHSKSLRSSESLQLCTEGLGSESSDDVQELKNGINENWEKVSVKEESPLENSSNGGSYCRRSRVSVGEAKYPPPISCIGKNGKPWVSYRSYRDNGRLVLVKEIMIPTQEFLHAHRENGRLKLNVVQPDDDEFLREEADGEEEEEEDDDNEDGESGACETDQVNEEQDVNV